MQRSSKNIQDKSKRFKSAVDQLQHADPKKVKAVAVKYDAKKGKAPKIIATGQGAIADKILELAEEHRIPMYEDATLTEMLSKLDLDMEIPPELYTMVAEVLAFVYHLDKLAKSRKGNRKSGLKKKADS
jgi:flagellar biosynthesis protein